MSALGPGTGGLAATGVVLLILVGAAWLLSRGALSLGPFRRNRSLSFTVETALSLGERRSLAVVSVEGHRLLLGLTPAHISLIGELGPAGNFSATLDRVSAEGKRS